MPAGAAEGVARGTPALERATAGMVGAGASAAMGGSTGVSGAGRSIVMNFSPGSIVLHAPQGSSGRAFAAEFFSALEGLAGA